MTQQTSGYTAPAGSLDPSTTHVARDQATQVGQTTSEAGKRVAGTATEQAGQVADEARRQARDLLDQARGQATDQARTGQQKASEGLRTLATELHGMADNGDRHGPASDLAEQAADKIGDIAEWLGDREPGDVLDEFRAMARRRPGAFLIGAAVAGVLAGRLTRGAIDANRDDGPSRPLVADPVTTAPLPPAVGAPAHPSAPPPAYPPSPTYALPPDTTPGAGYGQELGHPGTVDDEPLRPGDLR